MVSVIVPVYKAEKYLHRCIDSILNQTYRDLEVILVDDGSPDNCPSICDEYAQKDSRVKVIHQENKGVGAARNIGVKRATGEYIAFVDSDDWIEPNMYKEMLDNAIVNGSEMVICGLVLERCVGGVRCETIVRTGCLGNKELLNDILVYNKWPSIVRILYANYILKSVKQLENCTSEDYAVLPIYVWKARGKVTIINEIFYHYNLDNVLSITHGKESPKPSYAHFVGDRIRENYARILGCDEGIINKFDRMACRACVRAYIGNLVMQELNEHQVANMYNYLKSKVEANNIPQIGVKKKCLALGILKYPKLVSLYAKIRFYFRKY